VSGAERGARLVVAPYCRATTTAREDDSQQTDARSSNGVPPGCAAAADLAFDASTPCAAITVTQLRWDSGVAAAAARPYSNPPPQFSGYERLGAEGGERGEG